MTDPWLVQNTKSHNEEKANSVVVETGASERTGEERQQSEQTVIEAPLEFEDNFAPSTNNSLPQQLDNQATQGSVRSNSNQHQPLPDSATYLQGLERKLERLKKGAKLVEALAEKRQDCLRSLVQGLESTESAENNNEALALDAPIWNGESAVQEIYRHLQPVQPVTVGETVHIVQHDQLERQREAAEPELSDSDEKSTTEDR